METPRVGPEAVEQLTERERAVLELLRAGLTNEQIARRLGISQDGAKYHVSEIIGKLGVRNRREAAAWPERPPWWSTAALAPVAGLWRRVGASRVATGAAAGAFVVVAAGLGLLIWGLLRTSGGGGGTTAAAPTPTALVYIDGTLSSISDQQIVVRGMLGKDIAIRLEHAEGPEAQFCRNTPTIPFCQILSEAAPTVGEEVCVMTYLLPGDDLLAWSVQLDQRCELAPSPTPAAG